MHSTHALPVADQHSLARAFLALGDDDGAPAAPQGSAARAVAAFVAVVALAFAAPLSWSTPPTPHAKLGEQPAATLGSSKALPTPADDEDDAAD
jgi:hypothetical protein